MALQTPVMALAAKPLNQNPPQTIYPSGISIILITKGDPKFSGPIILFFFVTILNFE